MSLTKRLQQLFRADIHHVLENLEDPQSVLKLSMYEMQECIQELQQNVHEYEDNLKNTEKLQKDLKQKLMQQEENLKLSLQQHDESLIKRQIKRKLELQKMIQHKSDQLQELKLTIKESENELSLKIEKLDFLKQKESLLQVQKTSATVNEESSDWHVSQDDIELEYLRLLKQSNKSREVKK